MYYRRCPFCDRNSIIGAICAPFINTRLLLPNRGLGSPAHPLAESEAIYLVEVPLVKAVAVNFIKVPLPVVPANGVDEIIVQQAIPVRVRNHLSVVVTAVHCIVVPLRLPLRRSVIISSLGRIPRLIIIKQNSQPTQIG